MLNGTFGLLILVLARGVTDHARVRSLMQIDLDLPTNVCD